MTASIEGIWRLEFYGGHGWETVGTLTLKDGTVSGGSITHYTTGTFSLDGDTVKLDTDVNFYGNHKPFFGSRAQKVSNWTSTRTTAARIVSEQKQKAIFEKNHFVTGYNRSRIRSGSIPRKRIHKMLRKARSLFLLRLVQKRVQSTSP